MKLLLFLISLTSFSIFGIKCNPEDENADMQNEPDTLSMVRESMHYSVDTNATLMDSLPPTSTGGSMDSVSKETKYGTSSGKHEAPKHGSPNQEKIDSTKAAKKKKKD